MYYHYFYRASRINWSTILTFAAIVVALGGYFLAEWLRRRPSVNKLVVKGAKVFPQDGDYYGRLIITNDSENKAVLVEASVESIIDDGRPRENFLSVPLQWTHGQLSESSAVQRTVYGHQTLYLDIFSYAPRLAHRLPPENIFRVTTPIKGIDLFDRLKEGETILQITFYQENGQVTTKKVSISWDGKNVPAIKLR